MAARGGPRGPRVIAGELGGLRLVAPRGPHTRPTADRVKEAVFAALGDARLAGASVLDLYAGSGALAIEALSRGADRAVLVDRDRRAIEAVRANLATTGLTERARVVTRTVAACVRGAPPPEAPFDLVFADPPYGQDPSEVAAILVALSGAGWLAPGGVVVLEAAATDPRAPLPAGWMVTWERVYGGTLMLLAEPAAGPPGDH